VIAIEVDPWLAEYLKEKFAAEPRLEVVRCDVLTADLTSWGPAVIAGNLPYYITSPIMAKVVRLPFRRAVFLVQKEVAERLAAQPGSRDYGFLTVQTAVFAHARLLFEIKPSAFRPPPKVDSAVVLLEPRADEWGLGDREAFLYFVSHCFRQKRKTLRNNLAPVYGKQIDGWPESGSRAEQIPLDKFVEMFRRL
jgi:16S rRNA (adenine1518-N6/adenine1519-N6)-dimethyltransferase